MTFGFGDAIMVKFSWRKIYRAAGRSSNRIVLALRSMIEKAKNTYDPLYRYNQKDFSGESYLINPEALLRSSYTNREIAEYIILASLRNFSEYSLTGDATLPLLHSPVSEKTIKQNRLLSIENDRIKFKYEEVTN